MLLGTLNAAHLLHESQLDVVDVVDAVTRTMQPTAYWQDSQSTSLVTLRSQVVYGQVLAAEGEATLQDFARFAMEVIERQTSIDPVIDAKIAARLHEIFE